MDKASVVYFRQLFKDTGAAMFSYFMDNNQQYSHPSDWVVYNDEKETVFGFGVNEEAYTQDLAPIKVQTSTYEFIQGFNAFFTKETVSKFMDKLIEDGTMAEAQKKEVMKMVNSINNQSLAPIDKAEFIDVTDPEKNNLSTVRPMNV